MAKFSAGQDEILIEEIQKYASIYDYESDNYKNFLVKENAWKKIAFSLKKEGEKLQLGTGSSTSDKPVKWNLYQRLSFLDKVKHERNSKQTLECHENSDQTDPVESSNPSTQSATTNKSNPETHRGSDSTPAVSRCSSAASSLSRSNVKRFRSNDSKDAFLKRFEERAQKRTELLEALQNQKEEIELDEVDLFMKSISLTVKRLPRPLINEAKLGIVTLVNNLEGRVMSSIGSHADQYHSSTNTSLGHYFHSYVPHQQQPNPQLTTDIMEDSNIDDDIIFQLV
ncbi:hypothetical protein RI129_002721 [Pyrocoelia pectoralis]|uniref:MADF domain-containing protein n=1 Tax=Pyrocoelia pectoralis TaxID=417401 RepID=A0AAN7VJY0_9COLE